MPWSPIGPESRIASPGRADRGRAVDAGNRPPDAGGGDVHAVGLAVLHHLGVAARDGDPGRAGRPRHGAHFGLQDFRRQAGFQHIGDDQRLGARAGNGQVVDRAVDRQFADGAARKTQRADHEAVGGDGDARAVQADVRGIAQRLGGRSEEDAARRGLRSGDGWPCRPRRAPFRSADREIESSECGHAMRGPFTLESKPMRTSGAHTDNTPRRRLRRRPSARPPDAPACIRCRRACTAPASALPSAPRRTARPWDR